MIACPALSQSFTFASPSFTPFSSTTRSLSPRPWLTPTSWIFTTCPSLLKLLTSCSSSVPSSRMHTSTVMLAPPGSSPGAVVDSILSPRFTGVNFLILSHLIRLSGSGPPNVLQRPKLLPGCFSWTDSIPETCFNGKNKDIGGGDNCVLCSTESVGTTDHLFWHCPYRIISICPSIILELRQHDCLCLCQIKLPQSLLHGSLHHCSLVQLETKECKNLRHLL